MVRFFRIQLSKGGVPKLSIILGRVVAALGMSHVDMFIPSTKALQFLIPTDCPSLTIVSWLRSSAEMRVSVNLGPILFYTCCHNFVVRRIGTAWFDLLFVRRACHRDHL